MGAITSPLTFQVEVEVGEIIQLLFPMRAEHQVKPDVGFPLAPDPTKHYQQPDEAANTALASATVESTLNVLKMKPLFSIMEKSTSPQEP